MKSFVIILAIFSSTQLFALDCVDFTGSYKNDDNYILKLTQNNCESIIAEYSNAETGQKALGKITIDGEACHNFVIFPTTQDKYKKRDMCVRYEFDKHMLIANIFSKRRSSKKYKLKGNAKYYRDTLAGHSALYELYTGYKSITDMDMNAMFDVK